MSTIIKDLKQLRADLDVMVTLGNQLRDSRETSLALTKLQEGKMHIGNTIKEIEPNSYPYRDSKNASNENIDKYHVDEEITPMKTPKEWNKGTLVVNVKLMRTELDKIIGRIRAVIDNKEFPKLLPGAQFPWHGAFACTSIVTLTEAVNWYGMELGRLRDTQIG